MFKRVPARLCSAKTVLPAKTLFNKLTDNGIDTYFGVPDSLLKDLCAYITDTAGDKNICTANEGSAVSMALGHHLATGSVPCVYMQNSGFGNTINPILSLAHEKVYQVPMLLLVGWRGEPGVKDEPQHVAQGALQEELLRASEIPYSVLPTTPEGVDEVLAKAQEHWKTKSSPYALLVSKGTFEAYKLQTVVKTDYEMSREEAIKTVLDNISEEAAVVSTTGMPSREVFEHRAATGANHSRDFLTVGGMGHCSMIAAGIALQKPDKEVYVIDGDGAAIMHLGGFATVGGLATQRGSLKNYKHIVLNNGAHDSVGGQPTVGFDVCFTSIAKNAGYKVIGQGIVESKADLKAGLEEMSKTEGPCVLEVRINKGARKDIGRPTKTPVENKEALMDFLSKSSSA
eukprot:Rhum_TRINITY_DN600_c0_g1::Rhum_TRINITY_DN600_c0_g1_i1::g.1960::m.1960/K09459/E4.1.1.82; phosphonopyruvate decarboxylase